MGVPGETYCAAAAAGISEEELIMLVGMTTPGESLRKGVQMVRRRNNPELCLATHWVVMFGEGEKQNKLTKVSFSQEALFFPSVQVGISTIDSRAVMHFVASSSSSAFKGEIRYMTSTESRHPVS